MLYVLSHTAAFALLALVLWLPGGLAARRLSRELGPLRQLAAWCLGLGFWIVVLFVLAAVGQLHRPALFGLAAAVAVAAIWTFRRDLPISRRLERPRPSLDALLFGGALAAVLALYFLLAMSPTVSWDADVYHLTLPRLFVAHGGFTNLPVSVYSHWPLATELLYAMAMLAQDYVLAKLVHFGFGLLVLTAIWIGTRQAIPGRGARWAGALAMLLFLANGVVAYEIHVAYVDLAHAFFLTCGFLFMAKALDDRRATGQALLLSGVACGLTAGVKLSGIAGAAIVGALYLPRLLPAARSGDLGQPLRLFATRFALPVLVLWVPWLVKSALATGNPFYPLFYELFGGPWWSAAVGEQFRAWQSSIGMGRAPLDYLLLPLRVILLGERGYDHFDGSIGACWLALLPLALWGALSRPAQEHALARRCLLVAALYFALWGLSSQQMRFLIPVLPLLALAAAVAVADVLGRLTAASERALARRLAVAAALALAVSAGSAYLAAGAKSLQRYLTIEGDVTATVVPPAFAFVNRELADDAKLLFLNTNRGFFCDRAYLADSFFEASQIADWLAPAANVGQLRALLAAEDVSHLLIANQQWGIAYPPALFEMLREPEQITLLYSDPQFNLVALR